MKKRILISEQEKLSILNMYRIKKTILSEETKITEPTQEEVTEFVTFLNQKISELITPKIEETAKNLKIVGQFSDESLQTFRLFSEDNMLVGLALNKVSDQYCELTIPPNKQRAIGTVDISSEIPTIISSLTPRQKEILETSVPLTTGYTFNQVLQEFKPSLGIRGLQDQEAEILGQLTYTQNAKDQVMPDSACLGKPKHLMGTPFAATEILKVEPDGNSRTLSVCYGGLLLTNRTTYITTNTYPFTNMVKQAQNKK
jgi:hypothetical protein